MDLQVPQLPFKLNLNDTFGVAMICAFFAAILYGVMCLQCYIFFHRFSQEGRRVKCSVWLLWVMNTVHLAFLIHPLYTYMVTNFDNIAILIQIPWCASLSTSIPFAALSFAGSLIWPLQEYLGWYCPFDFVQSARAKASYLSWYTYRIWIISDKNYCIVMPLFVGILAVLGTSVALVVGTLTMSPLTYFLSLNPVLFTGMALIMTVDTYISIVLVVLLRRQRSRVVSKRTMSAVQFLMMYTVNTGLISSVVSLGVIIARAIAPADMIYISIYFILSPIYSNSLMGSLNARDWFRDNEPTMNTITIRSQGPVFAHTQQQSDSMLDGSETQDPVPHVAINIGLDEQKAEFLKTDVPVGDAGRPLITIMFTPPTIML
ncbi:uncharacterized protein PHACADRAFT_212026 [Phanerochaete carnosa HHB-10118-sp]|uniref:DUF6534 domain-containing protein n=1 Tax=Phanerochaete carnosa (strain HHB-10118-sp) TaxID=650164 RepID=K5USF8_PHACS|nr:uncharacterized protein PHACADRAFT_212026 [Phanerochaete carnosa HHB-10118-sp]EKM52816.1 hypothetical protein PHACADRAFT_212026 [Phanerochaete carnosa HHB-10118-sp]